MKNNNKFAFINDFETLSDDELLEIAGGKNGLAEALGFAAGMIVRSLLF